MFKEIVLTNVEKHLPILINRVKQPLSFETKMIFLQRQFQYLFRSLIGWRNNSESQMSCDWMLASCDSQCVEWTVIYLLQQFLPSRSSLGSSSCMVFAVNSSINVIITSKKSTIGQQQENVYQFTSWKKLTEDYLVSHQSRELNKCRMYTNNYFSVLSSTVPCFTCSLLFLSSSPPPPMHTSLKMWHSTDVILNFRSAPT